MFIGHAAVAFAARRGSPGAPLTLFTTAVYWPDLIWPIFLLLGWEQVRIAPGATAMTPLDFVHYPISHSLVATIAWGALFGWVAQKITKDGQAAAWAAFLVVSHWLLDVLVHRRDLPIWPGGHELGFGLWNVPAVTIPLELAMFFGGLWLYLKATRARGFGGQLSLWSLVTVLLVFYALNVAPNAPTPPDAETVARFGLIGWIFIPWCLWIDRTREERPAPSRYH